MEARHGPQNMPKLSWLDLGIYVKTNIQNNKNKARTPQIFFESWKFYIWKQGLVFLKTFSSYFGNILAHGLRWHPWGDQPNSHSVWVMFLFICPNNVIYFCIKFVRCMLWYWMNIQEFLIVKHMGCSL